MRKAILCFLQKDSDVLLLRTQYPDKIVWNGVSGYIEEGESAEQAACREVFEEIAVTIQEKDLQKLGEHDMFTVFSTKTWVGDPTSQEQSILTLTWFPMRSLPYAQMHEGNETWLKDMIESHI